MLEIGVFRMESASVTFLDLKHGFVISFLFLCIKWIILTLIVFSARYTQRLYSLPHWPCNEYFFMIKSVINDVCSPRIWGLRNKLIQPLPAYFEST